MKPITNYTTGKRSWRRLPALQSLPLTHLFSRGGHLASANNAQCCQEAGQSMAHSHCCKDGTQGKADAHCCKDGTQSRAEAHCCKAEQDGNYQRESQPDIVQVSAVGAPELEASTAYPAVSPGETSREQTSPLKQDHQNRHKPGGCCR
ncbi:MAG TPA: hypothetical protein VH186_36865 [Chloroflexia bacterium]|nr:hypothetical protein [Chloroflexia bacterium]